MRLREQWIRPLDALPQDYQHVIAITSSGQEEEMYLVDDKWHIVDGVRIPIEFVVFWHEKGEQPTVEMAEDCISREETIDAIYKKHIGGKDAIENAPINDFYACGLEEAVDAVEDMPSVTPQPKRGKWIHREDMDYLDKNKVIHNHFMCQNCGFVHDFIDGHTAQYKYCPSCGADMRESEDE